MPPEAVGHNPAAAGWCDLIAISILVDLAAASLTDKRCIVVHFNLLYRFVSVQIERQDLPDKTAFHQAPIAVHRG